MPNYAEFTSTMSATSYFLSMGAAVVSAVQPVNTVAPVMAKTLTGDHTVGQTYSVTPGTWTFSPTLQRVWQRDGVDIPGATGTSFTVTQSEVGVKKLSCLEFPVGMRNLAVECFIKGVWIMAPGEIVEAFDDLSRFASTGSAHGRSIDTVRKQQGTGSLAITGTGTTGNANETNTTGSQTIVIDPATDGTMIATIDPGDDPALNSLGSAVVALMRGGQAGTQYTGATRSRTPRIVGPITYPFRPDQITTFKDLPAAATGVRIQANQTTHASGTVRADACLKKAQGIPTFGFALDDIPATQRTILLGMLQAANMTDCATMFIPRSNIGNNLRMTMTQIREMNDAGIEVALNGTRDDLVINDPTSGRTTLAIYSQQYDEDQAWGDAQNFKRWRRDISVFPSNASQDTSNVVYVTKTAASVSGQTITVADATGLLANMRIVGVGAQSDARVSSGYAGGTSVPFTGTIAASGSVTLTFTNDYLEFWDGKATNMLVSKGVKLIRNFAEGNGVHTRYLGGGTGQQRRFSHYSVSDGEPIETITAGLDRSVQFGLSQYVLLHGINSNNIDGAIDTAQNKVQAIIDKYGAIRQSQAGVLLSMGDMLDRDFNSDYSLSVMAA